MSSECFHGTLSGYQYHRCRCDQCRTANREASRAKRAKRAAKGKADPSLIPHGIGGYNSWGCRCEKCVAANTMATRSMRAPEKAQARREIASDSAQHGTQSGYAYWGCRCRLCRAAAQAVAAPWVARAQAKTLEGASRHGQPWTGPELELIARKDLSARQVATMIGRTLHAVRTMRVKLNTEPKYSLLAGLGEENPGGES